MYKVNIAGASYAIALNEPKIEVDGDHWEWDLEKVDDQLFHLTKDSKSYLVELIGIDYQEKKVVLKINGEQFEAEVKDKYDQLLEKLGMNHTRHSSHLEVKAPMPGKILDILVSQGQTVKKGDQLLVLEAMKMENIIRAGSDGTVVSIFVSKGMNVEKNQVLIQF